MLVSRLLQETANCEGHIHNIFIYISGTLWNVVLLCTTRNVY